MQPDNAATTSGRESSGLNGTLTRNAIQARLLQGIASLKRPSIYDRDANREHIKAHRHEVKVWETRRAPQAPGGAPFAQAPPRQHHEAPPSVPQHVPPPAEPAKLHKAPKQQKTVTGRTFTSRFRGVHQTFPTKRWEAQFRRGGKPTSLGCFDEEEEAARTYDRMMIWCHLHRELSCKHGITNYDMKEYEADYDWLMRVSQEDLIEDLRSKGRRQAATRALRSKQQGGTFGMGGAAAAGAEDKQAVAPRPLMWETIAPGAAAAGVSPAPTTGRRGSRRAASASAQDRPWRAGD